MPDPGAFGPDFTVVAATLRKLCRHALPDLAPDTHLDDLPGMDSLLVLHVVAAMEETFGVEIDVAALDRLHRVEDILHAVRAAQNAAARGPGPAG